jgi:hypothetical protein
MVKKFGIGDFAIRLLFALALVLGTYNPSGKSYSHWLINNFSEFTPLMALAGVSVLIGWAIFLNSTFRSLGTLGVVLGLAFFGCVVWVMIDSGIISTEGNNIVAWITLVLVAAILAVGMSWSHLRRKWSGQQDVDDIGED